MKVEHVLANINKFPAEDIKKEMWSFKEMLCSIFHDLFGDYVSYEPFEEYLPIERFEMRKIFDIPFDSDEECYVYLFSFDGKPAAFVSKHGDRSDTDAHVIDMDVYMAMGKEFMAAVMAYKLNHIKDQPSIKKFSELDRSYMHWIDEDEGLFVIPSPKWQLGFWRMTEKHKAFKLTEDNQLHEITTIGKFLDTTTPSYKDDHCLVEVEINGVKEKMKGREIVFKLIAD
jgi:hypothetical protein